MAESKNASLAQLEMLLDEYMVKKAPFQIPKDIKEAIVKFGPWVVLIMMILSLPVIFGALAITAIFSPIAAVSGMSLYWLVPAAVLLVSLVFNVLALPGLFNRTKQGWRYSYYAQLLSVLSSILYGNVIGAIASAVIGLYILFQVKDMYK